MAGLIIGHTDHQSVKIWIQGYRLSSKAHVTLRPAGDQNGAGEAVRSARLEAGSDYTGVVDFDGLDPCREYSVTAVFWSPIKPYGREVLTGKFSTFPARERNAGSFGFILGSCNLSTVKVNNLLGLVAGLLGQRAASRALLRKPRRRFRWIRVLWRRILRLFSWLITMLVNLDTGFRQTGAPLLSSPFLRLSELFDNTIVDFDKGESEPATGCSILVKRDGTEVARGTLLRHSLLAGQWKTRAGPPASGFLMLSGVEGSFEPGEKLAFLVPDDITVKPPRKRKGMLGVCKRATKTGVYFEGGEFEPSLRAEILGERSKAKGELIALSVQQGYWKLDGRTACGTLLLTGVEQPIERGDKIFFDDPDHPDAARYLGVVAANPPGRPAFMIHAGDQVYYDFPFAHKRPTLRDYRRCYRYAWFEDDWTRGIFSRCPHYMTIDDHEIVDNYARDFEPRQPRQGFRPPNLVEKIKRMFRATEPRRTPESYSVPALRAYGEYVNVRHPGTTDGKYYYDFQYGRTPFFVLDTRTERYLHPDRDNVDPDRPRMISGEQLEAFKKWLRKHKDELKFVVSSVPFVAQVRGTSDEGRAHEESPSDPDYLDKWSGTPFQRQRSEIIDFIHNERIRNLVFLAGDVHCCYHATMRIGLPNFTSMIHELASGPIYQLRTGDRSHFFTVHQGRTLSDLKYRSQMEQVYGGASAAMHIRVRQHDGAPEVDWEVVKTISEPDLKSAPMAGCIVFDDEVSNYGRL